MFGAETISSPNGLNFDTMDLRPVFTPKLSAVKKLNYGMWFFLTIPFFRNIKYYERQLQKIAFCKNVLFLLNLS